MSTVSEVQPWELPATAEDVADSRSAARWSVKESGWKQVLPELPDDMIALLAPPVVVSAQCIVAQQPAPRARAARGASDDLRTTAWPVAERMPQLLAPAPPRRTATRRHRRS